MLGSDRLRLSVLKFTSDLRHRDEATSNVDNNDIGEMGPPNDHFSNFDRPTPTPIEKSDHPNPGQIQGGGGGTSVLP